MLDEAHIDVETGSATDLRKSGVARYLEDDTTRAWLFRYKIDGGLLKGWRPGDPDPDELLNHIREGKPVAAHNAAFERNTWNKLIVARYCPHWPKIAIEQQTCTMARGAAIAHPQALDTLGKAVNTETNKDLEGKKIMLKMAKPRAVKSDGTVTWWDTEENLLALYNYCGDDVLVEEEIGHKVPYLSDAQRETWILDQYINERGFAIDTVFVKRAAELVEYIKKVNDVSIRQVTRRAVGKCSQDRKIVEWLQSRGLPITSLSKENKHDVDVVLEMFDDKTARYVVDLRAASWKTSTAKYKAMLDCLCYDDRIRHCLNYHGASTGRFAGRLVQPQNFPRADPDDKELQAKIAYTRELLHATYIPIQDVYTQLRDAYGEFEPLDILSKALRSCIIADEGKILVSGDFSNIEGRVSAWLAGEDWKIKAFEDYDNGVGPDLYKLAYARSFGEDVATIGKGHKRQIGKVQELALGFQGGVGAYIQMGGNYDVQPADLVQPVMDATTEHQWWHTWNLYEKALDKQGLPQDQWTALKILVANWRSAHPRTEASWYKVQDAAIAAVGAPGMVAACCDNRVQYYFDSKDLWCVLPSGRMLCYANASIKRRKRKYVNKRTGKVEERWINVVYFWGVDSVTKQWRQTALYGGLQWENIVQAAAADMMINSMHAAESAGYFLILTVHDELVTEMPIGPEYVEHFTNLMQTKPVWARGLPVSVIAWQDKRYVK